MRIGGSRRAAWLIFVATFLLIVGPSLWAGDRWLRDEINTSVDAPAATLETGVIGLMVEPDDGRRPLLAEIDAARSSIDLMVYLLTDEPVVEALIDAQKRGVAVRVMLDQYPYGGFGNPEDVAAELRAAGIEVKWGPSRFTFTHVKTMIVDRTVALIMNQNLTRSSFEGNREFAIVTTRPDDVATAQALFEADWHDLDEPSSGPLVVSPVNSRDVLVGLIDSARTSLDIYLEVIRDDQIVEHLIAAASRGVTVRVILTHDDAPVAQLILSELISGGVVVRELSSPYIHAKAIVADDASAFVGSQNFTKTSLDENREIGLIFDEPIAVARLSATFDADFAAADMLT